VYSTEHMWVHVPAGCVTGNLPVLTFQHQHPKPNPNPNTNLNPNSNLLTLLIPPVTVTPQKRTSIQQSAQYIHNTTIRLTLLLSYL